MAIMAVSFLYIYLIAPGQFSNFVEKFQTTNSNRYTYV